MPLPGRTSGRTSARKTPAATTPMMPSRLTGRPSEMKPNARLEVFDENGLLWGHRSRVRQVVGAFLSNDHQN